MRTRKVFGTLLMLAGLSIPQLAVAQITSTGSNTYQSGRCSDAGTTNKLCTTLTSDYGGRIELAPGLPCTTCLVEAFFSRSVRTDAHGSFTIKLGPGAATLTVSAPGLPKVNFNIALPIVRIEDNADHELNAAVGGTLPVWRPWATGSVSGRIIATSPQTVASAVVYAEGQGMIVKPNADGYFALADVAPGPRKLIVTAAGHSPHSFFIQMPAGGHVGDVVVELDRGAARVPDTNPPKVTDSVPDQPSAADRQKTKVAPKPPLR